MCLYAALHSLSADLIRRCRVAKFCLYSCIFERERADDLALAYYNLQMEVMIDFYKVPRHLDKNIELLPRYVNRSQLAILHNRYSILPVF